MWYNLFLSVCACIFKPYTAALQHQQRINNSLVSSYNALKEQLLISLRWIFFFFFFFLLFFLTRSKLFFSSGISSLLLLANEPIGLQYCIILSPLRGQLQLRESGIKGWNHGTETYNRQFKFIQSKE